MAVGIRVLNTSGTVQIDENWKNFGFGSKVSVPFAIVLPAVTPYLTYTLTVPGAKAMVGVRASTFRPVLVNSWFDGTNYVYNYYIIPPVAVGLITETVDFYVFDVPTGGAPAGAMMKVFNASGELVFHDGIELLKIADYLPATTTFTGTVGRTYVPLIGINPLFIAGGRVHAWALRVVGNQIIPEDNITPKFSISSWTNAGTYAAIDVTGL